MTDQTMGPVESRFAALIWDNEPIPPPTWPGWPTGS